MKAGGGEDFFLPFWAHRPGTVPSQMYHHLTVWGRSNFRFTYYSCTFYFSSKAPLVSFYTITSFSKLAFPCLKKSNAFLRLLDLVILFFMHIRLWGRGWYGMAIWKKAFSDGCLLPYFIMGEVYVSLVFMAKSKAMGINKLRMLKVVNKILSSFAIRNEFAEFCKVGKSICRSGLT